jgi:hypothetical protein
MKANASPPTVYISFPRSFVCSLSPRINNLCAQHCDEPRVPDDVGEGGAGDPEPFEVLHPGVGGDVEVVEEARQEE